jgi:hypothetical protein
MSLTLPCWILFSWSLQLFFSSLYLLKSPNSLSAWRVLIGTWGWLVPSLEFEPCDLESVTVWFSVFTPSESHPHTFYVLRFDFGVKFCAQEVHWTEQNSPCHLFAFCSTSELLYCLPRFSVFFPEFTSLESWMVLIVLTICLSANLDKNFTVSAEKMIALLLGVLHLCQNIVEFLY